MKTLRRGIAAVIVATSTLVAFNAGAQSSGRAAAEALFQEATTLMDAKKYAEACDKFAASQELDPGLGTMLYLADCYDRAGRSASAWALFREVEDRSRRASQPDRERIAGERATALEPKLSKLEVRVAPKQRVRDLELRVGGSVLPQASWNVALPVDPGLTKIEARAPGKRPLTLQITVTPGATSQVIEIPAMADAPVAKRTEANGASNRAAPPPSSTQRTLGFVMSGVGVVALAAGGYFGYRAYAQNTDSKAECRSDQPNACTRAGVDQREQAKMSANIATIAAVSGGVLTVAGLGVVFTAPTPNRDVAAWQLGLRGAW
jgi:predicted negative regulator of RcsB-dependent stress response